VKSYAENPRAPSSQLIWQDKQHEVLFELIDQIKRNDAGAGIFRTLLDYAENHFTVEEAYMRQLHYPEADAHFQAHGKFRTELQCLIDDTSAYDANANHSLSVFLGEWLRRHIYGLDKQLEQFIMDSPYK
jgi:hemerythrin